MPNRLHEEKSPYLLQHKDNPVDWYPWGEEAFRRALREDCPIFLSIGYSTCHWCHVMAHESFEDPKIAEILNRDYICIKVDREERPDVDGVYMAACMAVTGSGGWPLTVLMTPEQIPFFVGTYFPKRSRYGQPGLEEILTQAARLWKTGRPELLRAGEQIVEAIRERETAQPKGRMGEKGWKNAEEWMGQKGQAEKMSGFASLPHRAYRSFAESFDRTWGGFGSAPKFPSPHNLLFLMRYALEERQPEALNMAEATLQGMARGGIQDQVGGGFSRYSTDEKWLVPHFEKMLYDNALLLLAYLNAYQMTRKETYGYIARRTADYILRDLTDPEGGFYCGQDADSDGVEGKYYCFTPAESRAALGEADGSAFCQDYGISKRGNFEGASIPNRLGQEAKGWEAQDPRWNELRSFRDKRTTLHKDDKCLLSWNAWTVLALARAGRILEEKRFLEAAERGERFLERRMTDGRGRLYLRYREGEAAHAGQLEDYGVYALALLGLYRATFRTEYLRAAILRAEQMEKYFKGDGEGYYVTASDETPLIVRLRETWDGAMPSGNSVAALVLCSLWNLTGEEKWQEAAQQQLEFLAGACEEYPAGHSFALLAMEDVLHPHRELLCATRDGVPQRLRRYLDENPAYGLSVLVKTPENADLLAQLAPFTKEIPLPSQGSVYYLCENGSCRAPLEDFDLLGL